MTDLTPNFRTGNRALDLWIERTAKQVRAISPAGAVRHTSGGQGGLQPIPDATDGTSGLPTMRNSGSVTVSDGHVFGISAHYGTVELVVTGPNPTGGALAATHPLAIARSTAGPGELFAYQSYGECEVYLATDSIDPTPGDVMWASRPQGTCTNVRPVATPYVIGYCTAAKSPTTQKCKVLLMMETGLPTIVNTGTFTLSPARVFGWLENYGLRYASSGPSHLRPIGVVYSGGVAGGKTMTFKTSGTIDVKLETGIEPDYREPAWVSMDADGSVTNVTPTSNRHLLGTFISAYTDSDNPYCTVALAIDVAGGK